MSGQGHVGASIIVGSHSEVPALLRVHLSLRDKSTWLLKHKYLGTLCLQNTLQLLISPLQCLSLYFVRDFQTRLWWLILTLELVDICLYSIRDLQSLFSCSIALAFSQENYSEKLQKKNYKTFSVCFRTSKFLGPKSSKV